MAGDRQVLALNGIDLTFMEYSYVYYRWKKEKLLKLFLFIYAIHRNHNPVLSSDTEYTPPLNSQGLRKWECRDHTRKSVSKEHK